jgi:uncharacterized protein (TIGR04255 family)
VPIKIKSEVYPNSPLVEVVFEIRFPGEPVVECRRDIFYELIRKDYPKVLVPSIKEGSFVALEPYRFEKEDSSSGVMLAINKLSYYSRKYPGFNEFRTESLSLVSKFRKAYPRISKISRTGFRYVNIIPFTREEGLIPLENFLTVSLKVPGTIPEKYNNISIGFVSERDSGSITTRIESMTTADKSGEAMLLDIDYAKEKKLSVTAVNKYIDESHKHARQLFEDLITDNYRSFLRGETL